MSKAALIHLTTELGYELGPDVRVNAVAPAVVKTKFAEALYEGREEKVVARLPDEAARRCPRTSPEPSASCCSADAGWITGQTLTIDGGVTLGGAPVARSATGSRARLRGAVPAAPDRVRDSRTPWLSSVFPPCADDAPTGARRPAYGRLALDGPRQGRMRSAATVVRSAATRWRRGPAPQPNDGK